MSATAPAAKTSLPIGAILAGLAGFTALGFTGQFITPQAHLASGVVAILLTLGLAFQLRRPVQQFPHVPLLVALGVTLLLVLVGVITSSFRYDGLVSALGWVTYGISFLTAVMVAGRDAGPRLILGGLFAAGIWMALLGIQEYASMKATDPTWRIFAGWVNPNAAAVALSVALFAGWSLFPSLNRVPKLLTFLGLGLIGFAILLTQSRGTLLTVGLGTVIMLLAWLGVGIRSRIANAGAVVAWMVLLVALGAGLQASTPAGSASGATSRIASTGETQEQSAGFRRLLWQGTVQLIRENPVGHGTGSYRYLSAQPGLTTQTILAHNSPLQLAAESGIVSAIAFLAFWGIWGFRVLQGSRKQPEALACGKLAGFAGIVNLLAHSLIDSDFHYFGIGVAAFLMAGAVVMMGIDACAPEFSPLPVRAAIGAASSVVALLLLSIGLNETTKAGFAENPERAKEGPLWVHLDADWPLAQARTAATPGERRTLIQRAVALSPNTRNWRLLARLQIADGDAPAAISSLSRALELDPRNLSTLTLMIEAAKAANQPERARQVAERLVAVEETPYFQVRSLPEIVPTETFAARVFLAREITDPVARTTMLRPAVAGYRQFATTTAPLVFRMTGSDNQAQFAGESQQTVLQKLADGQTAADLLATAAREAKDSEAEALARDAHRDLAAAFPK